MDEGLWLILNDGTVVENGRAGYSDGFLWLYMPGWTMQKAAAKVFNPDVMNFITFKYGEMQNTYTGYTVCTKLMQDEEEISVCMVKG